MNIIENAEDLIQQRDTINEALRDVMTVAKSKGYDTRTIRETLKLRALEEDTFKDREQLRDLYLTTVGLL